MAGKVESVNISRGGVPKASVFEAAISTLGLEGDAHRDLRYHGGPDRAVVLFSLEIIRDLQAEGHQVAAGSAGENLTVSGLRWAQLVPGTRLAIGAVELELTGYTSPCSKLASLFRDGDIGRINQKIHPGSSRLNARVISTGTVRPGDAVVVLGVRPDSASERGSTAARPVPSARA